jgi:hypothetical protein
MCVCVYVYIYIYIKYIDVFKCIDFDVDDRNLSLYIAHWSTDDGMFMLKHI